MGGNYEEFDISKFIENCAKRFCSWCGVAIIENDIGRKKKFCSDSCRYAFWNKRRWEEKKLRKKLERERNENS